MLSKTTNSLRASFTATFITKVFLVTWVGQVTSGRGLWVMQPGCFFEALLSGTSSVSQQGRTGHVCRFVVHCPLHGQWTSHMCDVRCLCCRLGSGRACRAAMEKEEQGDKKMVLGHLVLPCRSLLETFRWAQLLQFCLGL